MRPGSAGWFSNSLWYWLTSVTPSSSCWLGLGPKVQEEMWISRNLELIFFFFFLGCFAIQHSNHTFFWHSKCFWEEGGDVWDSQGFVLGLAIPIESIWWLRRSADLAGRRHGFPLLMEKETSLAVILRNLQVTSFKNSASISLGPFPSYL